MPYWFDIQETWRVWGVRCYHFGMTESHLQMQILIGYGTCRWIGSKKYTYWYLLRIFLTTETLFVSWVVTASFVSVNIFGHSQLILILWLTFEKTAADKLPITMSVLMRCFCYGQYRCCWCGQQFYCVNKLTLNQHHQGSHGSGKFRKKWFLFHIMESFENSHGKLYFCHGTLSMVKFLKVD